MRKPNFFIVGAAKCGTTSMHTYLGEHPDVFMSRVKEPYFFGHDLQIKPYWRVCDLDQYLALFAEAGDATCVGEASVWYLYSTQAAREIKRFAPAARILVMLRNPVDMMFSLHGQFLRSSNENILGFEEAIGMQEERRRGRSIPKKAHFPKGLLYADVADYAPQVGRYFNEFGRDATHVVIFDDLVRETSEAYRGTLEFLGLHTEFEPDFEAVNTSGLIRVNPLDRFIKDRPLIHGMAQKLLPLHWRRAIGAKIMARVKPLSRAVAPDPVFYALLQDQLRPQVDRLSRLLDRDLSSWCDHD